MLMDELYFLIGAIFYGSLTVFGLYIAPLGIPFFTYRLAEDIARTNHLKESVYVWKIKVLACAIFMLLGHLASSKVFSQICFFGQIDLVELRTAPLVCMERASEGYWNAIGDAFYPIVQSTKNIIAAVHYSKT